MNTDAGSIPLEDSRFYEAFEAWEAAADALHANICRESKSDFFDQDRLVRETAELAGLYDAWAELIEDVPPVRAAAAVSTSNA